MKIYLSHAITGLTFNEVIRYYNKQYLLFKKLGYEVLYPMIGKKNGFHPDHAIIERDRWMVMQSDIVYVNLHNALRVSIGCCMELAWAHDHGKHTVTVIEHNNINQHGFVREASDIIYENPKEAVAYFKTLINGEI